jgi:hypothetical protein
VCTQPPLGDCVEVRRVRRHLNGVAGRRQQARDGAADRAGPDDSDPHAEKPSWRHNPARLPVQADPLESRYQRVAGMLITTMIGVRMTDYADRSMKTSGLPA